MALFSFLGRVVCLRILIVARGRRARLRLRVACLRVFVVAIGVVCAPRLLFTCWGVVARLSCDRVIRECG